MALTGRKQAFADAMLAGKTKTEAAVVAGLSPKTASQAGSRLAKDKDVLAYMAKKPAAEVRKGGFTLRNGQKAPDAPPGWPFGTQPPAAEKPAETAAAPAKRQTAREFLSDQINDLELDIKLRLDAAKKLIEFEEAKPAPVGKKQAKEDAAKKGGGRFTPKTPPRLVAAGGKKV